VVARLKGNLPELSQAAGWLFDGQPPNPVFQYGDDRVELWDADDFPPWSTLRWPQVRVLRYRQYKPNGTVIQAEWLTDFPRRQVGSFSLFRLAKNRWEIENQGFNDGKNRSRHGAHLPSRSQQHAGELAADAPCPWSSKGCTGLATCTVARIRFAAPSIWSTCCGSISASQALPTQAESTSARTTVSAPDLDCSLTISSTSRLAPLGRSAVSFRHAARASPQRTIQPNPPISVAALFRNCCAPTLGGSIERDWEYNEPDTERQNQNTVITREAP
jgi:hypothetical protein